MDSKEFTDKLLEAFAFEKEEKYRSGIYAFTQRTLAYNSNKIEGSTLTEDQTAELFSNRILPSSDGGYKAHDVEETTGHFLMFDRMLETLSEPLSEDMIKSFHYELKSGVYEDRVRRFAIGDYKKQANLIGMHFTTRPGLVHKEMEKLLDWYSRQEKTFASFALFHARYELIHPFQDGNGRTGRMILFRECLVNGIVPVIIKDENRPEYIEGLREYRKTKSVDRLTELFISESEDYYRKCRFFGIEIDEEPEINLEEPKL